MRRLWVPLALAALVLLYIFWPRHKAAPPAAPTVKDTRPVAVPHWVIPAPPGVAKLEAHRKPNVDHVGLWMLSDPNLPVIVADSLLNSRFPRDSFPLTKYQVD